MLLVSQHDARGDLAGESGAKPWTGAECFLFRFAFLYFVVSALYWVFTFADTSTALLGKPYAAAWRPLVQSVAVHLLGWPSTIEPNFLHDTRYLYALEASFLLFSFAGSALWSIIDRRRTQYQPLNHVLSIFVRYVLAYLMLHYGMDKVFLLQFPAPALSRLVERFGDFSPNSLMWAFIGSSTMYTIFGGLAEISGALLLLMRKTTTLGALITFAVMLNVTIMDFSYDVTVKLLCLNILGMAVYLVLPDTRRLVYFFFLNGATAPAIAGPSLVSPRMRRWAVASKAILVLYIVMAPAVRDWRMYRNEGAGAPRPPLYGLYEVKQFKWNGAERPLLLTDQVRWHYIAFEVPNKMAIERMNELVAKTFFMHYDQARQEITLDAVGDELNQAKLTVSVQDADDLTMQGMVGGVPMVATLHRIDPRSFTLTGRGFHWISESSFVR